MFATGCTLHLVFQKAPGVRHDYTLRFVTYFKAEFPHLTPGKLSSEVCENVREFYPTEAFVCSFMPIFLWDVAKGPLNGDKWRYAILLNLFKVYLMAHRFRV